MEPKRLTDDELRAIRARAEAATPGRWNRPYDALIDMQLEARLVVGNVAGYEIAICENRADAEFIAHARADIPALLAHADALAAENARLGDALAELVDAEAHGTPGGYIGVDPSGETHDRHCTYCYTSWQLGEPERHAPDCPIAAGRRAEENVPGAHRCRS
jgi:hypothetical protein